MNRIQCPYCGEPHNYRDSSIGNLTRCATCGNRYRLPAVQRPTIKGLHTCLGCIGLLAFGGCLLGCIGTYLHREAHSTTQDSALKEQKPEEQEKTRQEEERKWGDPAEIKRRDEVEAPRKAEQGAKEESERETAIKADEKRKAKAETERERKRQAAEEAAWQPDQREREADKKREAAQQGQMKIGQEEKEAKRLLRLALQLSARGGFDEQVRERLQQIIDKYPDTPSAKQAQRQLDKMAK